MKHGFGIGRRAAYPRNAPLSSPIEWNESALVPLTRESFRFGCVRILPPPPCAALSKPLDRARRRGGPYAPRNNRQRKPAAVLKSVQPCLTTGNILKVSSCAVPIGVQYFSHWNRHSGITLRNRMVWTRFSELCPPSRALLDSDPQTVWRG